MSLVSARSPQPRSVPPSSEPDAAPHVRSAPPGSAPLARVGRESSPRAGRKSALVQRERAESPRRNMLLGLGDSTGFNLMVGLGENYFVAFALALGLGDVASALIAPVPMLFGALLQLVTPWAVRKMGSHRNWVVLCTSTQAASLLLMPIAAYFGRPAGWLAYLAATIYWGAVLASAPAWNTWIETVVPRRVRTRYFALRARLGQTCIFMGLVLGGTLLASCQNVAGDGAKGIVLAGFAGMFLLAAACRFVSSACLAQHSEPAAGRITERRVTLREFVGRLRHDSGAKLLVYLLVVQAAVQISGPFFAPYMLGRSGLGLTYFQFMVLIGLGFIGKVFAIPAWGQLAQRAGVRRLLWAGGLAIIPISGLWVFADSFSRFDFVYFVESGWLAGDWRFSGVFAWLAMVQIISGLSWAAYELAMALMFFESIRREERTSMLTIYNLLNQVAWVVGALVGAAALRLLGEGHTAYLFVFGLSAIARLATVGLLARVPSPQRTAVVLAATAQTPVSSLPAYTSGGPALAGSMQSPDAP